MISDRGSRFIFPHTACTGTLRSPLFACSTDQTRHAVRMRHEPASALYILMCASAIACQLKDCA